MLDLSRPATQVQIAEIIGTSHPAVSDVESRGICTRDMPLGAWLRTYMMHLREVAAGRLAAGDLDLAAERARLAKEQADKIGLQNAVTRRELAPVVLIEEVLAKAGARVAGILDAIPGQVRRRMPDLAASELEAISVEIAKARNVAAALSLADLQDDPAADADEDNPMDEAA